MNEYKLTIIGLVLSISLLVFSLAVEADVFEFVLDIIEKLERFEVDEFIIPVLILGVFLFFDMQRRLKKSQIEIEKMLIYKAMISAIHHILNNFLNQMQFFRLTANKTPGFDPDVLDLFDTVIGETSKEIKALSNISQINEETIKKTLLP